MLKKIVNNIIIFCFILGVLVGILFMDVGFAKGLKYVESKSNNLNLYLVFIEILSSNLIVSFFLSVIGFFTGGVLTCLLIIISAINLGYYIKAIYYFEANTWFKLQLFIYHGFLEIWAFYLFAKIGVKGFSQMKEKYYDDSYIYDYSFVFKRNNYYMPLIILFVAAIIESFILIKI